MYTEFCVTRDEFAEFCTDFDDLYKRHCSTSDSVTTAPSSTLSN